MTSEPQPTNPDLVPDAIDLDELLKDVPAFVDPAEWAAPGVFESDEDVDEFIAWVRAERNKELA